MKQESSSVPGKVLVIDDEDQFRQMVTKALGKQGFQVLLAEDGRAGLRLAAEAQPDLILCDLSMPVMDGYEVLAALRRDPGLADIPLIFLTGQSEPRQIRQGMNLGADDYLTKPVDLADLLCAVQVRLKRREALRQRQEKQTLLVKTLSEKRLVKLDEIERIVAYGEYSWVYWQGSPKGALLRKSLKQWLAELPAERFIRVHRRAIVNLARLERIEKLPGGRLQIHLRGGGEPILVSLRLAPILNRRLKSLGR